MSLAFDVVRARIVNGPYDADALEDEATVLQMALIAVLDRHKPVECRQCATNPHYRPGRPMHMVCGGCGSGINDPCPEVQLIAEQLGVRLDAFNRNPPAT